MREMVVVLGRVCCFIRGCFLPPALGLVNQLPTTMIGRPSGSGGTGESAAVEIPADFLPAPPV